MPCTKPVTTCLTEEEFGRVALFARKAGVEFHRALRLLIVDGLKMDVNDKLPPGLVNDVEITELEMDHRTRTFLQKYGVTMVSQLLLMMDRPDEFEKIPYIGPARRKKIMRALGRPPEEYADQFQ